MRGCRVVVEWVAVENLRSAELHCQYRARFLSSVSLFLSCSPISPSLSLHLVVRRSLCFSSLALFIFLSIALCGMKLSCS